MQSKLTLIAVIMLGCAPISPSVPKNCDHALISAYNATQYGARSYDVEVAMNVTPTVTMSGLNLTQTFKGECRSFTFTYQNDQLISKHMQ